ncbi:amidohydrolase [Rhodococcoides trifolii]|uniref:amidohydrolase n=1 Tax=Rhodococcoides trifolii TaxID=908250 RepID=UPI00166DCAAE|nr:amidohydrolase family protein [Rhodococcus trifolii]
MSPVLLHRVRTAADRPLADVRVSGGVVTEIGTGLDRSGEPVIDCAGGFLLPGFVDGHLHMAQWALSRRRIDVTSAASASETVDAVVAAVRSGGPMSTGVVRAQGFRGAMWDEQPHKDMLESALPGRRVAITSMDLHTAWLSPSLLSDLGIDDPTGVFRDQYAIEVCSGIDDRIDNDLLDSYILDSTDVLAAQGVTGVIDFEYDDNAAAWTRRIAHRRPSVRVSASTWPVWLDEALELGRRTGDVVPGTDGLLRVGPLKVMADGSLNTRTACCHDPYPDSEDGEEHGLLLVEFAELVELITKARAGGLAPAVHAIGDRANTIVLDAFEAAASTTPGTGGRIEHAQQLRPEDVKRFARAGVVASVQPQHCVTDRDVADALWAGRRSIAFPYGSLHASGADLQFGSDAPVSPPNPRAAIADAVWRTDDGRPPWTASESLPLDVAIRAACGGRASVEVGSVADLVVLAENPRDLGNSDLRNVPIVATVADGRLTYS